MYYIISRLIAGHPVDSSLIAEILTSTGGVGVIAVLFYKMAYRLFNHTLPRIADKFLEDGEKSRQTNKEISETQRSDFKESLDVQRKDFKEMFDKQRADFKEVLETQQQSSGEALNRERDAIMTMSRSVDKLADKVEHIT